MGDMSARLLALLSLLQTPREWPGGELAERLEVSPRTIRRDIDRLRELGYPVQATMGAVGGYRLAAGAAMPPLLLDDEEAVAIAVGLRTAAAHPVDGIEEASVRALAKLEQTRRLTEPYRLVTAGRRWYLLAYDNDRDDWRIFRADRIGDPHATGVRVPARVPPEQNPAAFVAAKLHSSAPVYEVVATVRLPAGQVTDRLGAAAGNVEPIDDHSCRLRGPADTLEWLASRLLLLGCEFEVHEPPELRAHLRALAARAARAARTPGT
ncbi:WYL domain-containing protein [Microbispora sp. ZYX-F-249]|uniref:WYL domain-containing protein n=1 Tax=Microbispora maris TaxID=3144104 RepID=A0ABV0AXY8_9ACTN